jgi:hypothetical protein
MTVSDLLEQPCNKSDNAVKFVPNLLQQLGTQLIDNIVNTQYKTLNNNVTVTKSNKCIYTWLAYLFNTQFCLRYTKHRPKPTRYRRYINLYSKIWHFCGCWCYVLRWIWSLWCYSECASTPGKLKSLPDHSGNETHDLWDTSPTLSWQSIGLVSQRSRMRFPSKRFSLPMQCGCALRITSKTSYINL